MTATRTCSSITPGINGEGYRSLQEGAKVSYDPEQGDKGPKAVNVQAI